MLRIRLLGGLSVDAAGSSVGGAAAQPRRLAVLAVIARSGTRGVPREALQALLWPDLDDERARPVLNHALYALRRDLGVDDAIVGVKELRLSPDVVSCDLLEFEQALAAGDRERAAAVYAGPFLHGFRLPGSPEFDRWADEVRTAIAHRYVETLEKLARDATQRGDADAAVQWWRRAAAQDPLNARFTTELMRALVATGNVGGALKQAAVYEALSEAELSLPPDREVVQLAERIRQDASDAAPAARIDAGETAAVAETAGAEPVRRRARYLKPALTVALAIVLVSLATTAVLWLRRRPATNAASSQAVVVVGVISDERGGERAKGLGTVADLLATSLARVQGLRVVSTARIYELLAQMGRDLENPTPADIAAAARRAGASDLIDGGVYRLPNGELRLDLRRTRLETGELVTSHTMVGANLFALVDSGTVRLARAAGGRVAAGSIADVTTASETAYRFYEEGIRYYFRNQPDRANTLFDAALHADSTFAMAAFYAALTYTGADAAELRSIFDRAGHLGEHASDRERLIIHAGLALTARAPSALAFAETLAVRYPLELEGHLYSGQANAIAGRPAVAIAPLLRVIRLDSLAFARANPRCLACEALETLTSAYAAMDSVSAALQVAERWARLQPQAVRPWHHMAFHRITLGQIDEAAAALKRAQQLDPALSRLPSQAHFWIRQDRPDIAESEIRRTGDAGDVRQRLDRHWFAAIALREQGKFAQALAETQRARELREPSDTLLIETRWHHAQILLESGQPRAAAALLDTVANLRMQAMWPSLKASYVAWALAHRATALFEAGDTASLAALADTIARVANQTLNRRFVPSYVRGLLLYARGDYTGAAGQLEASLSSYFSRVRLYLARAYVQSGRPERAVPVLQNALRQGIEGGSLYTTRTELHEALAHAWTRAGRPDSAAAHYRVVARSWRDADRVLDARRDAAAKRVSSFSREGREGTAKDAKTLPVGRGGRGKSAGHVFRIKKLKKMDPSLPGS